MHRAFFAATERKKAPVCTNDEEDARKRSFLTQQQTRDLEHSRSRAQTTPSPTLSSPSYPLTTSKAQGRERMGKRDDGEGQFL